MDLVEHIENYDEKPFQATYPLTVWSKQYGIEHYKYAREIQLVGRRVNGVNLMIKPAESDAFDMLKADQKEDYKAHYISNKAFDKLKEELLDKYDKTSPEF